MKAHLTSAGIVLSSVVMAQTAGAQPYQLQMALGQYCDVDMDPALDATLDAHLADIVTQNPGDPAQVSTGAVLMVARYGKVVYLKSQGLRDGNPGLGGDPNVAMTTSTIFDLESMTKPLTATLIMKLHEQGILDTAEPVDTYVPDFYYVVDPNNPYGVCPGAHKGDITVEDLLRYTSGLDIDVVTPLYARTDANINGSDTYLQISHEPAAGAPLASVLYSDLGYRLLGHVAERAYAAAYPSQPRTLRQLVRDFVVKLGMADTDYEPAHFMSKKMGRVAGTGLFAHHGLAPGVPGTYMRGEVQDDQDWWTQRHNSLFPNAMSPGDVGPTGTGCDGLFSTAWDLGKYAQMLLNNGQYYVCGSSGCGFQQMLSPASVQKLTTIQTLDNNSMPLGDPAPTGWTWDLLLANKGFGFELAQQRDFSVGGHALAGFSKTGGAGTFLIGDPAEQVIVVVLTNHGLPDFGDFIVKFDEMLEEIGPHRISDSVAAVLDTDCNAL